MIRSLQWVEAPRDFFAVQPAVPVRVAAKGIGVGDALLPVAESVVIAIPVRCEPVGPRGVAGGSEGCGQAEQEHGGRVPQPTRDTTEAPESR